MFRTLRLRLLLILSIVVILIAAFLGFAFSRATTNEFQRFAERDFLDYERLVTPFILLKLENYLQFRRVDCDQSIEQLRECQSETIPYSSASLTEFEALVKELARNTGTHIVVEDNADRIIANSEWGNKDSENINPDGAAAGLFLIEGNPFLVYIDLTEASGLGASQLAFLSSVNRALVIAVVSAVTASIILNTMLSRRILGPIEKLMQAVRRFGQGDLDSRVTVRSNDEIGELADAFNTMAEGLAHLEKLRRQMVSDIAHELRTPLTNVQGYLEAIQDGLAKPDTETINSLYEEVILLSRMVGDLQDLAMAESGELKMRPKPLQLKSIIENTLKALFPRVNEKSLLIHSEVPPSLPDAYVDPERIGQVLRNLLVNAISYTPDGGEIKVVAQKMEPYIKVAVIDNGLGISPEHLPLVFERFYRVDLSRTRLTGGAGLGLSIVKQLVEAQGGEVGVNSEPGLGSTFWFTAPMHQEAKKGARLGKTLNLKSA